MALHPDGAGHGVAPRPSAGMVESVAARQVPGGLLGDEEGLVREALPGERLGPLLGAPRQQVAPGRVAEGAGAGDRVGTLRQLKARGWWKEPAPRGRSGAPLIPRIPTERRVLDLSSSLCCRAPNPSHTAKRCGSDPCVSWCECVALVGHLVKLQEACDAKANHRVRCVMNAMDVVEKKMGRESPETPVAPSVDDRRARPGRGCRNGQHG